MYEMCNQIALGNFPAATDEIGYESKLVHWCHGAGGIQKIYVSIKITN